MTVPKFSASHGRCRPRRLAPIALSALAALAHAADNPAEDVEHQQVDVIGTSPLPGLGTPLRDVPANVQVFGSKDIQRQKQANLSEFLEQNPTSVTVNAAQGNPYQTDISFRGFTASPLLGTPQGLSVFQDGVRINEPFGDVVNWDLLPQSAIQSIQLIPGSNPAFGLNTLGGALAIYTKSGSENPGTSVELSGGSFGRITTTVDHGGAKGPWDWFLTANYSKDDGWAQHNPSRVEQVFGKLGWQTDATDVDLSLTGANNRLDGTQTLPKSFLDDPTQAYTFPDTNKNRMWSLALKGSHFLSGDVLVGGDAYARNYLNISISSDVNDDYGDIDADTGLPDLTQAFNDRSDITQDSYGAGLQLTLTRPLAGRKNSFVVGGSGDFAHTRFSQSAQPAEFSPDRATVATGDFEPGTDARTTNRTLALYLMDTLELNEAWALTASGRYNDARVSIRDESGQTPALDGDHGFQRFNPAIGATFNPTAGLTTYASYNEGMRAPTAIELTCADPLAPCKLPNAFLADPPLNKVVAKTIEIGARGKAEGWSWSAAAYRTDSHDDIQFIASGNSINAGYFRNVGTTRRQGVELMLGGPVGPVNVTARYAFIDATYLDGFVESSPNNSSADENGDIVVAAGSRIPSIPRNSLHLRLDAEVLPGWQLGGNLVLSGPSYARGDENNQDVNGQVPGYAVVNLDTIWHLSQRVSFFGRINNLFDRHYSNFGILGQNVFANAAHTFDPENPRSEQFLGQGAPFGAWAGVRLEWD
jgi:outer membrane receptor protein involved in Fe transport